MKTISYTIKCYSERGGNRRLNLTDHEDVDVIFILFFSFLVSLEVIPSGYILISKFR